MPIFRKISILVAVTVVAACASTRYNLAPGAGGVAKSSLHLSNVFEGKYLGEVSPDALRKRCGTKGLKDVSLSYGFVSVLIRYFAKLDSMDLEYRCGAKARSERT